MTLINLTLSLFQTKIYEVKQKKRQTDPYGRKAEAEAEAEGNKIK